jgi:hypothetical protein
LDDEAAAVLPPCVVLSVRGCWAGVANARHGRARVWKGADRGRWLPIQSPASGLPPALPALEIQTRRGSTDPIVVAPNQARQVYWPHDDERAEGGHDFLSLTFCDAAHECIRVTHSDGREHDHRALREFLPVRSNDVTPNHLSSPRDVRPKG